MNIFTSIEGYDPSILLFSFYMMLVTIGYIAGRIDGKHRRHRK